MLTKRQFLKGLAGSAALLAMSPLRWLLPKEKALQTIYIPTDIHVGDIIFGGKSWPDTLLASGVLLSINVPGGQISGMKELGEVLSVDGNTITIK